MCPVCIINSFNPHDPWRETHYFLGFEEFKLQLKEVK